jgi:hypothetical protein
MEIGWFILEIFPVRDERTGVGWYDLDIPNSVYYLNAEPFGKYRHYLCQCWNVRHVDGLVSAHPCMLCVAGGKVTLHWIHLRYHCLARLFEPTAAGYVHHIRGVSCYHISVALHLIFEANVHYIESLRQPTHHIRFREEIEGKFILNREPYLLE